MTNTPRIAIADYGMGNLRSAEKALEKVGVGVYRAKAPDDAAGAAGLILPGVGAFPEAMRRIESLGFAELVRDEASRGTPVLGICLGMQLLFSASDEHGGANGLGLIEGTVTPLDAGGAKVPHIGWSPVAWTRQSRLTDGLADEEPFYFVHSFAARPEQASDSLGTAVYGERFCAVVERDNVYGAQFHPEKSSGAGLRLLGNFAAICAAAAAPVGT